jgi:hypothetical protein
MAQDSALRFVVSEVGTYIWVLRVHRYQDESFKKNIHVPADS